LKLDFCKRANAVALSRMEKYLAVIKVLDNWDSITQKQIMSKAELNLDSPKEFLNFLVNLDLIIEKNLGKKKVYSLTSKGQKLWEYFRSDHDDDDDESIFGAKITRID
jgi:predicted transcriptional regulator